MVSHGVPLHLACIYVDAIPQAPGAQGNGAGTCQYGDYPCATAQDRGGHYS